MFKDLKFSSYWRPRLRESVLIDLAKSPPVIDLCESEDDDGDGGGGGGGGHEEIEEILIFDSDSSGSDVLVEMEVPIDSGEDSDLEKNDENESETENIPSSSYAMATGSGPVGPGTEPDDPDSLKDFLDNVEQNLKFKELFQEFSMRQRQLEEDDPYAGDHDEADVAAGPDTGSPTDAGSWPLTSTSSSSGLPSPETELPVPSERPSPCSLPDFCPTCGQALPGPVFPWLDLTCPFDSEFHKVCGMRYAGMPPDLNGSLSDRSMI